MAFKNKAFVFFSYFKAILIVLFSMLIASFLNFGYTLYQLSRLSIDEFRQVSTLPLSIFIAYLSQTILFAGLIFAGYFIAKRMKGNMILHSIILAIIWLLVTLVFSLIVLQFEHSDRLKSFIYSIPSSALRMALFTTIGGFIAKYRNK